MEDESLTLQKVADAINNHEYKDLADYVRDVEWERYGNLIHKLELRHFTKSIRDKEKRRFVMHYLHDNAGYYFEDAISKEIGMCGDEFVYTDRFNGLISVIHSELEAQLHQLEDFEETDIVKLNRLQERIRKQDDEIQILKTENKELQRKVHYYEHPSQYGKGISAELNHPIFLYTMEYLAAHHLALKCHEPNEYGIREITCYSWQGSKALFGYFVDKISYELELRDSGGRLNWKPFSQAFINFDEIVKEARNKVSKYSNNDKIKWPEGAETVEEAIKYAQKRAAEIAPKSSRQI